MTPYAHDWESSHLWEGHAECRRCGDRGAWAARKGSPFYMEPRCRGPSPIEAGGKA